LRRRAHDRDQEAIMFAHTRMTSSEDEPRTGSVSDDKPEGDLADQQRTARADDPDDAIVPPDLDSTTEADPADAADQRRIALILDEDEGWS
jgi:hypothetical protein